MLVAVSDLRSSTNVQAQSRDVTSATLRLEQVVNQLEASLRAFVVSGNDRFLGSWRAGARRLLDPALTSLGPAARSTSPPSSRQADAARGADPRLRQRVRAAADRDLRASTPSAARAPVATREGARPDHRDPDRGSTGCSPTRRRWPRPTPPRRKREADRGARRSRSRRSAAAVGPARSSSASSSPRRIAGPVRTRRRRREPASPPATSRRGSPSTAPPRSAR